MMSHVIIHELDHQKKRLEYYQQIRDRLDKAGSPTKTIDKWIDIYSRRIQELELKATDLGLQHCTAIEGLPSSEKTAS